MKDDATSNVSGYIGQQEREGGKNGRMEWIGRWTVTDQSFWLDPHRTVQHHAPSAAFSPFA